MLLDFCPSFTRGGSSVLLVSAVFSSSTSMASLGQELSPRAHVAGDHLFHITNWICCYSKAKLNIACLLLLQYSVFPCYFSQRVHIYTKGRGRCRWTFLYQIIFQLEVCSLHCQQEEITTVFCGSVCGSLLWCFRSAPLALSCGCSAASAAVNQSELCMGKGNLQACCTLAWSPVKPSFGVRADTSKAFWFQQPYWAVHQNSLFTLRGRKASLVHSL